MDKSAEAQMSAQVRKELCTFVTYVIVIETGNIKFICFLKGIFN